MTMEERIEELNRRTDENPCSVEKRTYTVSEIQDILEIGRNAAYDLCKSGKFKCVKIGGSIRISRKSFDEWLDKVS